MDTLTILRFVEVAERWSRIITIYKTCSFLSRSSVQEAVDDGR